MSQASSSSARNSWLLLAALAAGMFVLIWLRPLDGVFRTSATSHAAAGRKIPSQMLQPLAGSQDPINPAELKGQVLLVNFWGVWCPPCREELPHLAELARGFSGQDFRLIAVSCGGRATEDLAELTETTADYLKRTELDIPAYADADGKLREQLRELGAFANAFPTTLAVDRQGVIHAVWEGYRPGVEDDMQRVVASLLTR